MNSSCGCKTVVVFINSKINNHYSKEGKSVWTEEQEVGLIDI
jgi:hypothetical protein